MLTVHGPHGSYIPSLKALLHATGMRLDEGMEIIYALRDRESGK